MRSSIREWCCMQRMQYRTAISAYWLLKTTLTSSYYRDIVLRWYWRWQTVGLIWNWKQIAEHFNSWHLPTRQKLFRIPCPDRSSTRPELTAMLCHLMYTPETPSSDDIDVNESFVISSYSVTCTLTDVNGFNQARHHIFAQSSRTFENLRRRKQPW